MPKLLMGFDFGQKRLGLAVGDDHTQTARPLKTVSPQDWREITRLVKEWQPAALIVGIARHQDGSDCGNTRPTLAFAQQLRERFTQPVLLIDEHLSSWAADEWQLARAEAGQRAVSRDAVAAAVILESYLRTLAVPSPPPDDESSPDASAT